jgi:O-antigen ligase
MKLLTASYDRPSHFVVAAGIGWLLGVSLLWLSPLVVLGAVGASFVVFVILKRPELGLLGILVATSTILPEAMMLRVPIGVGHIYISDAALLALLGLIILRWLVKSDFEINRTPLDYPLLCFFGVAMLSTSIAILKSSVEVKMGLTETRYITYYLSFFVVTNLVREDRRISLLLKGLYLLATIVALTMVVQYLVGAAKPFLPGRVETLSTQGISYSGITRVVVPGQSLVVVAFTVTTVTVVLDKLRSISVLRFFQWGLFGLAVLLTFFRNYWILIGLVIFLLFFLIRGKDKKKLLGWILVVALTAAIVLAYGYWKPRSRAGRFARATFERVISLGSSKTYLDSRSTLRWRDFEYKYAFPQIMSHPLIGLGLGSRYRPFILGIDHEEFDGRTYMHNGHIWILVKTGILGYICFVWLSLAFLLRGFKYWRRIRNSRMRGVVLGFTLTYLGILVSSLVEPTMMKWEWIMVIGIMMGLNEVLISRDDQSHSTHKLDNSWHNLRI